MVSARERLGPAELGLLASLGVTNVRAYPRPKVAVLSTGDELVRDLCADSASQPRPQVEPSEKPGPGRIRDSNRTMLLAAITKAGGVPIDCGLVVDNKVSPSKLHDLNS